MTSTGLAAVAAAAAVTFTQEQHDQAVAAAREEGRQAGLAEGREAGRKDGVTAGAEAERQRILGIEAHALPGHETLIAECKADPACTPDQAAARILAAEKKARGNQLAGIADVEKLTGGVGAAAASQRRDGGVVQPPQAGTVRSLEAYKADWEKDANLQADFASADAYANYAKGVAEGRIRVLNAPAVVKAS